MMVKAKRTVEAVMFGAIYYVFIAPIIFLKHQVLGNIVKAYQRVVVCHCCPHFNHCALREEIMEARKAFQKDIKKDRGVSK